MKNIIISIGILTIFLSCAKSDQILKTITSDTSNISNAERIDEALTYCSVNNFNQDFCILVDMSMHSGKKRFFICDLKNKQILKKYLVSHGCGDNPWSSDYSKENPAFSNIKDSHSSSLGKYRIGDRGWSSYGINVNYRIHGLEATNSNANIRDIVLHSWYAVSNEEVYPYGTAEGWGCPAISNDAFLEIDPLLKNSKKAILMWIYK